MPLDFPPFRPHPLVRGGHLQTIVGSYLPSRIKLRSVQHRVPLPDGDSIVLHDDGCGAGLQPARGSRQASCLPHEAGTAVAILVHGLGGCHQSGYMLRCSAKLRARGVRVFRMDLRGCGAGMALARYPLHAGRSEDAAAALAYVSQQCPDSPIHLVGFSMGANIILKLAGELGPHVPANLAGIMAVSPPIDLVECSRNMQRGFNRYYDRLFVRGLIRHIRRRASLVPAALSRPLVPRPRRLIDFDSLFTAPLSGFADVTDYYSRASSGPLLPQIAVPTLIIAAASDPIVPVEPFERASYSASTELAIAPCGGHLGFIAARASDPDRRWLDWRVVEWVTSHSSLAASSPHPRQADNRPMKAKSA